MHKAKNWVLLADAGNARVMERTAPFGKLKELFQLTHTHQLTHEHGHDRPGRDFESGSPMRHAYEPPSDWHELQKEEFAKELTAFLKSAYEAQKFNELSIVSPPHMLGLLRSHLNHSPIHAKIIKEAGKNLLNLPLKAVQEYIDKLPSKK